MPSDRGIPLNLYGIALYALSDVGQYAGPSAFNLSGGQSPARLAEERGVGVSENASLGI
jgi:hypothetical protein